MDEIIYHKGDRVVSTGNDSIVPKGEKGTVLEDSEVPYVQFDNHEICHGSYRAMITGDDIVLENVK